MEKGSQLTRRDRLDLYVNTCLIGLFGGLFTILFLFIIHYFNMIEFNLFTPWKKLMLKGSTMKWYDYFFSVFSYSVVSIIIAFIYYGFGKRRMHWDIGALYGILLGVITYIFLPILLYDQHLLNEYALKTHISFFVSIILFGIFIGYSISYEFYLRRKHT
ncbi:MAG TPA: YqhR family membrane protein [Pseudogracilibacillus sp.]|nr:YqhR family membrane protein [Pseudogracilibacillus sp.]